MKFLRHDHHKKKKLKKKWRKPKGLHNKMRLQKRGYPGMVKPGYRTPVDERGKTESGKEIIEVRTAEELEAINAETEAALLMKMGKKKKTQLIKQAQKADIELVNLDADAYLERVEQYLEDKKARKQRLQERKTKAPTEEAEEAEEEAEAEEEVEDESEAETKATTEETESEEAEAEAEEEQEEEATSTAPTKNNTKKEIKAWLDEQGIEYTTKMLKAELLELVEEHK